MTDAYVRRVCLSLDDFRVCMMDEDIASPYYTSYFFSMTNDDPRRRSSVAELFINIDYYVDDEDEDDRMIHWRLIRSPNDARAADGVDNWEGWPPWNESFAERKDTWHDYLQGYMYVKRGPEQTPVIIDAVDVLPAEVDQLWWLG